MDINRAKDLQTQILQATERLHLSDLEAELTDLKFRSEQPDFWQDNLAAQTVMKQIAKLESRSRPWRELLTGIADAVDLLQLNDVSMQTELTAQLETIGHDFETLKEQL